MTNFQDSLLSTLTRLGRARGALRQGLAELNSAVLYSAPALELGPLLAKHTLEIRDLIDKLTETITTLTPHSRPAPATTPKQGGK